MICYEFFVCLLSTFTAALLLSLSLQRYTEEKAPDPSFVSGQIVYLSSLTYLTFDSSTYVVLTSFMILYFNEFVILH